MRNIYQKLSSGGWVTFPIPTWMLNIAYFQITSPISRTNITVGVHFVGPNGWANTSIWSNKIISLISNRTTLNVGFCIAAHKILVSFPVWLKIQTPTWVLVSGIKAESTVWSGLQRCCSMAGVGVKWPDLLSRTAKSAPELTNLEAELTFLEAEPQRESVRTYKVGPTANTSGHSIYMCSVV